MRYRNYRRGYYRSRNMSPMSILGPIPLTLFIIGVFFLAFPIFLAALVVFAAVACYVTWRAHRTMHRIETEFTRYRKSSPGSNASSLIIDVTPGHEDLERRQS